MLAHPFGEDGTARTRKPRDIALQFLRVLWEDAMAKLPDREILLRFIPEDESVGNITLIEKLRQRGWDKDKYWRLRNELIEEGVLERGKGKGGSVRRVVAEVPGTALGDNRSREEQSEHKLYPALLKTLQTEWVQEMGIKPHEIHFEITAKKGKKKTGGKWSRPDITAISVRSFAYVPNKFLDVWTFEVKKRNGLDVTAIFEALAHGSRATRSYAVLQVPAQAEKSKAIQDILARCEREAARLGIGLITFEQPSKFETWETLVEAPRLDTAPEYLEEYIQTLSQKSKDQISQLKG